MTVRSTAFAESAPVALPGQERRYRILGTLGMLGSPLGVRQLLGSTGQRPRLIPALAEQFGP